MVGTALLLAGLFYVGPALAAQAGKAATIRGRSSLVRFLTRRRHSVLPVRHRIAKRANYSEIGLVHNKLALAMLVAALCAAWVLFFNNAPLALLASVYAHRGHAWRDVALTGICGWPFLWRARSVWRVSLIKQRMPHTAWCGTRVLVAPVADTNLRNKLRRVPDRPIRAAIRPSAKLHIGTGPAARAKPSDQSPRCCI